MIRSKDLFFEQRQLMLKQELEQRIKTEKIHIRNENKRRI